MINFDNFDSETRTPEETDRIFVVVCGGIWGIWLIVSAVAAVALVNLGRGDRAAEGSPWLLYTVIAISALVVIGAIPLLLKARRVVAESRQSGASAATGSAVSPSRLSQPPLPVAEAPTEKIRVFGTSVDPRAIDPRTAEPRAGRHSRPEEAAPGNAAGLDRLWLRGTASLLGAMGLALIAVSTATYLLASEMDIAAWVGIGVAALFTAAMPAVLVAAQRHLDELAGGGSGD